LLLLPLFVELLLLPFPSPNPGGVELLHAQTAEPMQAPIPMKPTSR
jgi:hypothetical protein